MKTQQEKRGKDGRFPPGVSGNPDGRPIGSISIVALLKRKLEEIPEGQQHTYGSILVQKIIQKCLDDGDTSMIRDLISRVDGMPKQSIEQTGEVRIVISHD